MFNYNILTNLFLKKEIKSYVKNNSISVSDIIVCISCLNNYYIFGDICRTAISLLYSVEPLHIYLYLFFSLPKKTSVPYATKIRKFKVELCPEYEELGKVFGWSKKETLKNTKLLDMLYNKKQLKVNLGIR